jgi:hypothetical protein
MDEGVRILRVFSLSPAYAKLPGIQMCLQQNSGGVTMTCENSDKEVQCGSDIAPEKKHWSAPQLTATSIAMLTEGSFSTGNDGAGSFTLS